MRTDSTAITALILILTATSGPLAAENRDPGERLRRRLEAPTESGALVIGDQPLFCAESIQRFYQQRRYALAWSQGREPIAQADSLLAAVRTADRDGLDPLDYHLVPAQALLGRASRALDLADPTLVDLDLLLTDTFLLFATHCLSGHLDPASIDPEWVANRRSSSLPDILESALAANNVGATLRALLPPQVGYTRLRTQLQELRKLRDLGGWPLVPGGEVLKPGASGPRVVSLASRMWNIKEPDPAPGSGGAFFDEELAAGARLFQQRHGLDVDGVVGPATLAALNVSVEDRIAQVIVNLERWRWLPQDLGRQHVLVNIADQRLRVYVEGRPILESAVIVGRAQRRTPVFSGQITYLVFRPYWEVPPSLAVQDKLPILRADPQRMVDQGFEIFRGWGENEKEIDPLAVDWTRVGASSFPYRLRQRPGPQNALGSIKFMFPNKYNVYLHDTPARELFDRSSRTFSSGCIRVQRSADLALTLLADQPRWTAQAVEAAMNTGHNQTVRLHSPWLVHLEYWTAWVESDGTAHYRNDVYGRDARVLAALRMAPPALLGGTTQKVSQ